MKKLPIIMILLTVILCLSACEDPLASSVNSSLEGMLPSMGINLPAQGTAGATEHIHDFKVEMVKEPDCTEMGFTRYRCDCGEIYEDDFVDSLGHRHEVVERVEGSCMGEGFIIYSCECGDTYEKPLPRTDHNYVKTVVTASCTENGYTKYDCECGFSFVTNEVPAGHKYDENGQCANCSRRVSVGLTYAKWEHGEGYVVTGIGTCKDADLVIPEVYEGLPVKEIYHDAFKENQSITSVDIPDSVQYIDLLAFCGCSKLSRVTLPDTMGTIRSMAFAFCALTEITIPASISFLDSGAFFENPNLTNVYYKGNLEQWLGINMFPQGSPCINGANLYLNGELFTTAVVPAGSTSVGAHYAGIISMTSVSIPDGVTFIDHFAFFNCKGLTSLTLPNSVKEFGYNAFAYCTGLTSFVIPDGVKESGGGAFEGCTGLKSITIPDSVTKLNDLSFYGCSSLTTVTIPNSVTEFGNGVFEDCTSLTSITIPGSVKKMGTGIFWNCTGLKSVQLSEGLKEIPESMFQNCTGLTSITIPSSVKRIGGRAFIDCTSLTSVSIPAEVTEIDYEVFFGCTKLKSISYAGTKQKWDAIVKGAGWDYDSGIYTVYCTDGEIKKGQ